MQTDKELFSELVRNAELGKHRQFQYLRNYHEYFRAIYLKRALRTLITSLKRSTAKQFKTYCRSIIVSEAKVIKLITYCTTVNVLRFYEEELRIVKDMILEYECYLVNGNLFDFVLGLQRPTDKLWDHRSL